MNNEYKEQKRLENWTIDKESGWFANYLSFPKRLFLSGICVGIAIGIGIGIGL